MRPRVIALLSMLSIMLACIVSAAGTAPVSAAARKAGGKKSKPQAADDFSQRPAGATDPNDPKLAWYRQAKFGLFIHWGLYAVPAGT